MALSGLGSGLRHRHNEQNENNDVGAADQMEEEDEISDSDVEEEKPKSRRPKENPFTQQKLKAVHPILTPKNVIPALIILAVIFLPLGGAMLYGANKVEDLVIDYSQCEKKASLSYFSEIPSDQYEFHFHKIIDIKPQWKLATNTSSTWDNYPDDRSICQIQFQIPDDIGPAVFFFYRLKNFYPNHRRFATSFSEDQLTGKQATVSDIKDTVGQNCEPLSVDSKTGKIIYPCGLIANSLFNDTYSDSLSAVNGTSGDYALSKSGIAWKYNSQRYKKTTYDASDIVPPPNWVKMFPNGYTNDNIPDISKWENFQNWMSPAALTPFSKMFARNDDSTLKKGLYQINVGLHFPVLPYNGHKYIYLSTRSVIGGRNSFLGICWIVGGGLCIALAVLFIIMQTLHPRKLGDSSLLSWNNQDSSFENQTGKNEAAEPKSSSGTGTAKESSSSSSGVH